MTNPAYGSSLFQARKTEHTHRHSHLHSRKSHSNLHAHSHKELHNRGHDDQDQNTAAVLDARDSTVTEVVQTVSVVQLIDGAGATVSAQTLMGDSQTQLVDAETGATVSTLNVADKAATTTTPDASSATDASASATVVSSSDSVAVSSASTTVTDTAVIAGSSTSSLLSSYSSSFIYSSGASVSLTPALSLTETSASSYSTLSSSSNSTTTSFLSSSITSSPYVSSPLPLSLTSQTNSSISTVSDQPSIVSGSSSFLSTTFASSTTSAAFSVSSSSGTFSDSASTGWFSASESPSATYSAGGTEGSGASITPTGSIASTASAGSPSSSASASASGASSSGTSTQTSEVVGGIFGGIAGIALIVAFAFMILRMKKSGWCQLKLPGGDDGASTAAAGAIEPAPASGPDDSGSGAYGTMQRTGSQSVAASAIAALAGKRASRERAGSGPEMAERGFVRVSGRKLPPVLQYGGDGYTDPRGNRNSQNSDVSASVYRDSMAVFDQPNHTPLALGSPMRPVSGIMTVNPGPRRTPVTSQAPSSIDSPTLPRSSTFPSTENLGRTLQSEGFSRDAIGRTLAPHDYSRDGAASRDSRGSGRFTEHVS